MKLVQAPDTRDMTFFRRCDFLQKFMRGKGTQKKNMVNWAAKGKVKNNSSWVRLSVWKILKIIITDGKSRVAMTMVVPSRMLFCSSALATDIELRWLGTTWLLALDDDTWRANELMIKECFCDKSNIFCLLSSMKQYWCEVRELSQKFQWGNYLRFFPESWVQDWDVSKSDRWQNI